MTPRLRPRYASDTSQLVERAIRFGGCIARVRQLTLAESAPAWWAFGVSSHPINLQHNKADAGGMRFAGYGCHWDRDEALLRAIVECVERISTSFHDNRDVITATARELGDEALDLDLLPICSITELKDPYCDLELPSKDMKIRWTLGFSLKAKRNRYVPLVLSRGHVGRRMPGEHFTHPITTGCAAHRSFELAAANAILEVIERDALASTWLLKRSVRRINLDEVCQPVKYFCKVQKHFGTEVYFFDISTDLNIPVVLGLQRRPSVPFACSLLSCSAAFSYEEACEKVVRDAAICRYANRVPIPYSSRPELFRDVRSGAAYMADVTRASAFDFLTETNDHISLHELDSGMTCFRPRSFSEFDSALSAKLREVILVDLTTPESSDLGIHVVRAILPDLQPISFHQRARFLGHSRLIDLARREGRKPQGELEINSAPLPFA